MMDTLWKITYANIQWLIAHKLIQKLELARNVIKITYFRDTDVFQHTSLQSSVMCMIRMANVYSAKKALPVSKESVTHLEKYKKFMSVKMSELVELSRLHYLLLMEINHLHYQLRAVKIFHHLLKKISLN
jgi:hypothetical protein